MTSNHLRSFETKDFENISNCPFSVWVTFTKRQFEIWVNTCLLNTVSWQVGANVFDFAPVTMNNVIVWNKCLVYAIQKLARCRGVLSSSNVFHSNGIVQQCILAYYWSLQILHFHPGALELTKTILSAMVETSVQFDGDQRVVQNGFLSGTKSPCFCSAEQHRLNKVNKFIFDLVTFLKE